MWCRSLGTPARTEWPPGYNIVNLEIWINHENYREILSTVFPKRKEVCGEAARGPGMGKMSFYFAYLRTLEEAAIQVMMASEVAFIALVSTGLILPLHCILKITGMPFTQ